MSLATLPRDPKLTLGPLSALGDSYLCNEDVTGRRCHFLLPVRLDWSEPHQAVTCESSPAWPSHSAVYLHSEAHSYR